MRQHSSLRPCGFDFQEGHWEFAMTSGRTMTLGSIQPLIEKSRHGKGSRLVGLTTLSHSCVYCLEILGASTSQNPVQACIGRAFIFKVSILLI
jgi:hypothetical protein